MFVRIMLSKKYLYSPSLKRLIVSIEKDEKVVNPPRKPIVKKIFVSTGTTKFSNRLNKNPIRNEPIRLTEKVPDGKIEFIL